MRTKKAGRRQKIIGCLFFAPAAIMIGLFMIVPLVWNLVLSFCSWNGNSDIIFVGLTNFVSIFKTPGTVITIRRSIFLTLLSTAVSMGLGMVYAIFMYRLHQREQGMYRFFIFSPAMLPMTVTGLLFVFVLSPNGLLNGIFAVLGLGNLQQAWLAKPTLAMWVIGIVQGWKQSGVVMILCATAMLNIPASLYECAVLEGANYWDQVRLIILPLIKPTLALLLSTTLMSGFKSYDIVYAMTKGGPGEFTYTMPLKIIQLGYNRNDFGSAAALGTVLVIIASIFVVIARTLMRGETYEY